MFTDKNYQSCPSRSKYSIIKNYDYYEDFLIQSELNLSSDNTLKDWCNNEYATSSNTCNVYKNQKVSTPSVEMEAKKNL